jgi:hypothetical protein
MKEGDLVVPLPREERWEDIWPYYRTYMYPLHLCAGRIDHTTRSASSARIGIAVTFPKVKEIEVSFQAQGTYTFLFLSEWLRPATDAEVMVYNLRKEG